MTSRTSSGTGSPASPSPAETTAVGPRARVRPPAGEERGGHRGAADVGGADEEDQNGRILPLVHVRTPGTSLRTTGRLRCPRPDGARSDRRTGSRQWRGPRGERDDQFRDRAVGHPGDGAGRRHWPSWPTSPGTWCGPSMPPTPTPPVVRRLRGQAGRRRASSTRSPRSASPRPRTPGCWPTAITVMTLIHVAFDGPNGTPRRARRGPGLAAGRRQGGVGRRVPRHRRRGRRLRVSRPRRSPWSTTT